MIAGDLPGLVRAVRDADLREPETTAVEWKRSLDLDDADVRFDIAQHLLGFANRSVAVAALSFAGFAYLLIGVSPGELAGVEVADPARLDDALTRFIAPGRPNWELTLAQFEAKAVAVLELPPPQPGDRIATLQRAHKRAEPGRIFVRRPGKTVEASPEEIRMLEERFAQPSHQAASREAARHETELRRLAVEEERAAHERRERAERRAARFMPSTRSPGLVLDPDAAEISGMVVNAGGPATVTEAFLRPERGGAYPGGVAVVYGSGPLEDPLGRVRVEQGVDLLVRFRHAALSALRGTVEPLVLTLQTVDDSGFESTEVLVVRRQGSDVRGRDLWSVSPDESRRSTEPAPGR